MKLSFLGLVVLIMLMLAVNVQAIVVEEGRLQAIYPETRTIVINQKSYRLKAGAPVYRRSAPEKFLPLTFELRGQQVNYDLGYGGGPEPVVLYLMILD